MWLKFSSGEFGAAASTPQRRRGHAAAGATRALLTPGLLGRVTHEFTAQLSARALTGVGLVGNHELVHQRFVVFAAEHGIGRGLLARLLTLFIEYIEFH